MAIKKTYLILSLLLTGLLSLHFQCNKRLDCAENRYSFKVGIRAYPDKDSIRVGDTLWLEVNEPATLTDMQSGRVIDYSRATNLGTAISFAKLIAVGITNDQVAKQFSYLLLDGTEVKRSDTAKYKEFAFSESNGRYRFKLGIVPHEQGVYKMFVSNASDVYRLNDNCTKANFVINFKETNQHFYFNKVSFPGIALSGENGVYFLKVN